MSEEQTVTDQTPTRKSRRLFWTLLGLTLIAAITPLAVMGYRWHRQMDLIERITSNLGDVELKPTGPEWLRELLGPDRIRGFDTVVSVHLTDGDVHLSELSVFSEMTELHLFGYASKRDREQFRYLRDFESLESLSISVPSLDDDDFTHVGQLHNLTKLEVRGDPKLTDRCLETISDLLSLRSLTLSARLVTDEGLKHLTHLRLKELAGWFPFVTEVGLEFLERNLSDCDIDITIDTEIHHAIP